VREVEHRTFSASVAVQRGQPVLYVTERCVFRLCEEGLELIEIAPGIDLERDVLALMDFAPLIKAPPRLMDARIFRREPMQLREDMLRLPLEQRFAFDAGQGLFFANFEGMTICSVAEVEQIRAVLEERLHALGGKVPAIVDYDNFSVLPDALDAYISMVHDVAGRHYSRVSRYTTSAFLRSKLGGALQQRGLAPHIFASAAQARDHLANTSGHRPSSL
jgi:propionate CoA-transferase